MAELDAVVLGGAAVDWIAQVDALPERDTVVLARAYERFPGGSAANVAVGLARLGQRVGFVGKLGADEDGRFLLHAFAEEGVDTQALIIEPTHRTASCFIAVDDGGERMIIALPGAALIENASELNLTYLQQCRALYVGAAYPEVAMTAMSAVHEAGGAVFYAPGGAWGPEGLPSIRPLLQKTDVCLVSRTEAQALASPDAVSAARMLQEAGPPVVIVTLGKHGAIALAAGHLIGVPAFAVDRPRDTTGAGDAFAAGWLAAYLQGSGWEEATRIGCAAAALKIQHLGARSGLPRWEQVQCILGPASASRAEQGPGPRRGRHE